MSKYFSSIMLGFFSIFLLLVMTIFPEAIIDSSINGLKLWIESVFPSLFPFLIIINIMTHLGIIDFIGTLLTPIISPLFGISGLGSMPVVAGLVSGYPIGAKLTCQLYSEGRLSKDCASKVICYSNNSGPLFIVGSVGVGMFGNIAVGYFVLLTHILAPITLGILINLYSSKKFYLVNNKNIFKKSCKVMATHLNNNKKTVGEILSFSVSSSISTIVSIGGYIVLFSVIIQSLQILNFNSIIKLPILQSLFYGVIEMTNGIYLASRINSKLAILITCFLVGFGGFSIHAQAISFISKTDLKVSNYLIGKFASGLISLFYGYLFYPIFNLKSITPTFYLYKKDLESFNYYYIFVGIILIFILFLCSKSKLLSYK